MNALACVSTVPISMFCNCSKSLSLQIIQYDQLQLKIQEFRMQCLEWLAPNASPTDATCELEY